MKLRSMLLVPLHLYKRYVSPWLPPACRVQPTCSEYAMLAIDRHGAGKGVCMAVGRLLRCNPFFRGGFDPPN